MITDEPNGHAAPIAQTKYLYEAATGRWMVAFPEGDILTGAHGPRPADVSRTTIGGLPMLPSGARFDTTIIPLSPTLFLVIKDGGGSAFTTQLAKTVASAAAHVSPAALSDALKAEADAYGKQ
jgi:sarcosine oxidase gamma subunit